MGKRTTREICKCFLRYPKVRFDDSILYEGSAAFGWFALRWLYDNAGIAF